MPNIRSAIITIVIEILEKEIGSTHHLILVRICIPINARKRKKYRKARLLPFLYLIKQIIQAMIAIPKNNKLNHIFCKTMFR